MSVTTIIGYAVWVVILFFCGKWFIQGLKDTYKEKSETPVKVKRWLQARTIFAWFLVVLFGMMNIAAANQTYKPSDGSENSSYLIAHGLGYMVGIAIRLGGLALSLWWVRKLGRERRQRRFDIAEQQIASAQIIQTHDPA
jgi:hypothetical protein